MASSEGARGHHRPGLIIGVALIVLVVAVAGAAAGLAAGEKGPTLHMSRLVADRVTLPGAAPALDFSDQGESAVTVAGIGLLGSSGPVTPLPIASVAKVMTAYVVLLDHPLAANGAGGFSVTISAADAAAEAAGAAQGQSVLPVAAGETLTEQQLLEGLLLPSGDNIAAILATTDAGSTGAFVSKMNAEARALGMASTTYTDPSGLDPATMSTATDQLHLAAAAMAIPAFAEIVGLPQVTLPVAGVVRNFNDLIGTDGFIGIKTGSDSRAGGCLMWADQRTIDGTPVRMYGVVLGQEAGHETTTVILGAAFTATRRLADSAAASLQVRPVLAAGTPVLEATNPDGRTVAVTTGRPLSILGYGGERVPVDVTVAPVGRHLVAGQQAATVHLPSGGTAATTTAAARATMPGPSWSWRLRHVI